MFGRDIFNNQELSFEPNMNIATPQSYVLGPGDAVFVDIYGASQKSEQCTVSPEGEITIEGFGPVHVGGLTVDQANRRLRSTLGARYSSSKVKLSVGQTRTIIVNVMGGGRRLVPTHFRLLLPYSTLSTWLAAQTTSVRSVISVYRNNVFNNRRHLRLYPQRKAHGQCASRRQRRGCCKASTTVL